MQFRSLPAQVRAAFLVPPRVGLTKWSLTSRRSSLRGETRWRLEVRATSPISRVFVTAEVLSRAPFAIVMGWETPQSMWPAEQVLVCVFIVPDPPVHPLSPLGVKHETGPANTEQAGGTTRQSSSHATSFAKDRHRTSGESFIPGGPREAVS